MRSLRHDPFKSMSEIGMLFFIKVLGIVLSDPFKKSHRSLGAFDTSIPTCGKVMYLMNLHHIETLLSSPVTFRVDYNLLHKYLYSYLQHQNACILHLKLQYQSVKLSLL